MTKDKEEQKKDDNAKVIKLADEIENEVKKGFKSQGGKVDSDFRGDLEDVVSDVLEDEPNLVKNKKAFVAKAIDEML